MLSFLLRRLAAGLLLLLATSALAFVLLNGRPEAIARGILGQEASNEQVAAKVVELGLDQPLVTRYLDWLVSALQGDLGRSWFSSETVTQSISSRLPVTLSVVLGVVLLSALAAFAAGTLAAVKRGSADRIVQIVTITGYGLPGFLVGLFAVTLFAVQLGWFPATGYIRLSDSPAGWLATIALPVLALCVATTANVTQQVRSAVAATLNQEFIRTLRSRGISENRILVRHVLRNAATPALTVLSLEFVGLLGGAVVIESIFALPGIGAMAVQYTARGDIPVVMGLVTVTVVLVVVVNMLLDLAVGWLNPRARRA